MTCLEAQSNIMAFIEKKLPDDAVLQELQGRAGDLLYIDRWHASGR